MTQNMPEQSYVEKGSARDERYTEKNNAVIFGEIMPRTVAASAAIANVRVTGAL